MGWIRLRVEDEVVIAIAMGPSSGIGPRGPSHRLPRLQILYQLEAKLARPGTRGAVKGLEDVADVVTSLEPLEDVSSDPSTAV